MSNVRHSEGSYVERREQASFSLTERAGARFGGSTRKWLTCLSLLALAASACSGKTGSNPTHAASGDSSGANASGGSGVSGSSGAGGVISSAGKCWPRRNVSSRAPRAPIAWNGRKEPHGIISDGHLASPRSSHRRADVAASRRATRGCDLARRRARHDRRQRESARRSAGQGRGRLPRARRAFRHRLDDVGGRETAGAARRRDRGQAVRDRAVVRRRSALRRTAPRRWHRIGVPSARLEERAHRRARWRKATGRARHRSGWPYWHRGHVASASSRARCRAGAGGRGRRHRDGTWARGRARSGRGRRVDWHTLFGRRRARNSARARERLAAAAETDTVLTSTFDTVQRIPWPEEFRGRALKNSFTDAWHGRETALANDEAARQKFDAARQAEDYEIAHLYAGQGVALARRVEPASVILSGIAQEAERLLQAVSARSRA